MNTGGPDNRPALDWPPLLLIALAHAALHLFTAGNYGIFRDEYYYIACANRLAWGYVDHPPFSIALLAGWKAVFGDGVLSLRILPALSGAALVILTGLLTAELGGRRFGQVLAALGVAAAVVVMILTGFYSMNAFDLVFWVLAWWLLARWLRTQNPILWPWLGLLLGVALLNKIGIAILAAALAAVLVLSKQRRWLRTRWPWIAGGLAAGIFAPHLIWQMTHGWPTLEFIANAQREKIVSFSVPAFWVQSALEQNPCTLLLWPAGLAWLLLARSAQRFRALAFLLLLSVALVLAQRSKPYYATGPMLLLHAAGGAAWEQWTRRPKGGGRKAWRAVLTVWLIAGGVALLPMGVPLLSPGTFAAWQAKIGLSPAPSEVGHTSTLAQYYSDRFGWEELAATVGEVYASLPETERSQCVVIVRDYGLAASLEYWRKSHDLPQVVSGHNNYWFWGPGEREMQVGITIGWGEAMLQEFFGDVRLAGTAEAPWALEPRRQVWICREPKITLREAWPKLKAFI